jgi:hypothetical protein
MRVSLACTLFLIACSSSHAGDAAFPPGFRGFWVDDQATCDVLKSGASPADLRDGQRWLKIAATDILGTTQGRLLREIPAQIAFGERMKKSFEFQIANDFGLIPQLNFAEKGLRGTVTGAHTSRWYFKCS